VASWRGAPVAVAVALVLLAITVALWLYETDHAEWTEPGPPPGSGAL
jgi:hypothetical protein